MRFGWVARSSGHGFSKQEEEWACPPFQTLPLQDGGPSHGAGLRRTLAWRGQHERHCCGCPCFQVSSKCMRQHLVAASCERLCRLGSHLSFFAKGSSHLWLTADDVEYASWRWCSHLARASTVEDIPKARWCARLEPKSRSAICSAAWRKR